MRHQDKPSLSRGLLVRVGMLVALAFASLPLGGCIVYAPPHYHLLGLLRAVR